MLTPVVEFDMQILEGMPMTDEVEELLRVLGPFYELIEEKKKISHISDVSTGGGFFPSTNSITCFLSVFGMSNNTQSLTFS